MTCRVTLVLLPSVVLLPLRASWLHASWPHASCRCAVGEMSRLSLASHYVDVVPIAPRRLPAHPRLAGPSCDKLRGGCCHAYVPFYAEALWPMCAETIDPNGMLKPQQCSSWLSRSMLVQPVQCLARVCAVEQGKEEWRTPCSPDGACSCHTHTIRTTGVNAQSADGV